MGQTGKYIFCTLLDRSVKRKTGKYAGQVRLMGKTGKYVLHTARLVRL
jgi:hypothetical protein